MPEYFSEPDDFGEIRASELHSTLGESLAAQAGQTLTSGPLAAVAHSIEYGYAQDYGGAPAELPIKDAKERVKQEGLDGDLKLPDQDTIRKPVLDLMVQHAHDRRQYEAAVARGPHGFFPDALGFVTQMGAGMIDPLGAAAFMIPVLGEARYGKMLAVAGESMFARAAVRGGVGAAQGAVGGAALAPADWWLKTQDGQDYTMADALKSVVLSAGMGAAFHTGIGVFHDLSARATADVIDASDRALFENPTLAADLLPEAGGLEEVPGIAASADVKHPVKALTAAPERNRFSSAGSLDEFLHDGKPLFFSDPVTVEALGAGDDLAKVAAGHEDFFDAEANEHRIYWRAGEEHAAQRIKDIYQAIDERPLDADLHREIGRLLGYPEDKIADFLARHATAAATPPEPARVLADLPPRVQEDALQAAAASIINGELPRAAEMLVEAAKDDPRIAESVDRAGLREKIIAQPSPDGSVTYIVERDGERIAEARLRRGDNKTSHVSNVSVVEHARRQGVASRLYDRIEADLAARGETLAPDEALSPAAHALWQKRQPAAVEGYAPSRAGGMMVKLGSEPALGAIDNSHDVVSGANSSKDPNGPVYVDRRIPQFSPALKDRNGQPAELWKYLAIHERRERAGMARARALFKERHGRAPDAAEEQRIYESIHSNLATPAERKAVEGDGVDWSAYTHEIDGYLARIEHENVQNPPPDTHVDPQAAIGHHRAANKQGDEGGSTVHVRAGAARGPRARNPDTWSLLEFLASRGGIDPGEHNIGDVRSLLGTPNKFIPGFGHLIRKGGMTLDHAREAAVEAGYIHDNADRTGGVAETNVNALLDAMDGELRGQRVYKQGVQPEMTKAEREHFAESSRVAEERFNDEIDRALKDVDIDPSTVAGKLRARMVEIMRHEDVADPVEAYERAEMESRHHDAEAGEVEPFAEKIPGWDELDDSGSAPAGGDTDAGAGNAEGPGTRQPSRQPGQADRTAGQQNLPRRLNGGRGRADFQKLQQPRAEDPDLAAESRAAEKTPDVASTDAVKAPSAAQAAAGEADKLLADILPTLSEDERRIFEDALSALDQERDAREVMVRDGAACLAAASAEAAA